MHVAKSPTSVVADCILRRAELLLEKSFTFFYSVIISSHHCELTKYPPTENHNKIIPHLKHNINKHSPYSSSHSTNIKQNTSSIFAPRLGYETIVLETSLDSTNFDETTAITVCASILLFSLLLHSVYSIILSYYLCDKNKAGFDVCSVELAHCDAHSTELATLPFQQWEPLVIILSMRQKQRSRFCKILLTKLCFAA